MNQLDIDKLITLIEKDEEMSQLAQVSDPKVDCKRIASLRISDKSDFVNKIKNVLAEKKGNLYRSAKNMVLIIQYWKLDQSDKLILRSYCSDQSKEKPSSMSENTCKNFIDLIDELKIAEIGVIAPVDILASELDLVKEKAK